MHRHLLLPAVLLVALTGVLSSTPAGACAAGPDDPCLEDRATSTLRGSVFTDRAADGGPRAATDTPRVGVRVWLDADEDALRDPDELAARTGDDGSFELEVDPGAFPTAGVTPPLHVEVAAGQGCTHPVPCVHREPIVAGEDRDGVDFGLTTPAALLGQAQEDADDDGRRGRDEVGAPGVTMYLDVDHDGRLGRGEPQGPVAEHGGYRIDVPVDLLGQALTVRSTAPQGVHCKVPRSCAQAVLPLAAGEVRRLEDRLFSVPLIVFVHGFLGSEIGCPGNKAWFDGTRADLLDMQLAPDGRSNLTQAAGGTACSERSGPTGQLILSAAGKAIYGPDVAHYSGLARAERFRAVAWDWRKDPESQVHVLDRAIDELRCGHTPPCERPLHGKVVLVAHSQGGLLSRMYISDPARAAKVRRLVTVGTPTWGSPKSIFPMVAGIETPIGGVGMDVFLDDDDLKVLYRNLAGGFALLPSASYGPWLSVPTWSSDRLDADTLPPFARAIGANDALIRAQTAAHRRVYDHYDHLNGVDYEVVVGRGVPTITDVQLQYGAEERIYAVFGDGDMTVPSRSAAFDAPASKLHTVCGVGHVPLTADPQTTAMVDDFVALGEPVKPNPRPTDCAIDATVINVYDAGLTSFDLTNPVAGAASSARRLRVATRGGAGSLSVEEAQARGLVQVLRTATQTMVVVDDRRGVTLTLPAGAGGRPYTVTTQQLDGTRRGPVLAYPPQTGAVTVATGTATALTSGGRRVRATRTADVRAPRTAAVVRRLGGGRVRVALRARDRSPIAATYLFVGERRRRVRGPVVLSARDARRATFASVDRYGNSELRRPLRVR